MSIAKIMAEMAETAGRIELAGGVAREMIQEVSLDPEQRDRADKIVAAAMREADKTPIPTVLFAIAAMAGHAANTLQKSVGAIEIEGDKETTSYISSEELLYVMFRMAELSLRAYKAAAKEAAEHAKH